VSATKGKVASSDALNFFCVSRSSDDSAMTWMFFLVSSA